MDWEDWARALAGACQEDRGEGRTHRYRVLLKVILLKVILFLLNLH